MNWPKNGSLPRLFLTEKFMQFRLQHQLQIDQMRRDMMAMQEQYRQEKLALEQEKLEIEVIK